MKQRSNSPLLELWCSPAATVSRVPHMPPVTAVSPPLTAHWSSDPFRSSTTRGQETTITVIGHIEGNLLKNAQVIVVLGSTRGRNSRKVKQIENTP